MFWRGGAASVLALHSLYDAAPHFRSAVVVRQGAAAVAAPIPRHLLSQRRFSKQLFCTRAGHLIEYHFACEDGHLIKVGQYPSTADIEKGDTDRYEAVLGREKLKELNRAIGLASHGVGIGAHVYLRRIFEGLVEDAHRVAQLTPEGWDEPKYQQGRMSERIKMLKGFLPEFLSENPQLYAILSQGIHELTEQECLANFEALKLCIEVILDEKLRQREQEQRVDAARKALARIDGAVGTGKDKALCRAVSLIRVLAACRIQQ